MGTLSRWVFTDAEKLKRLRLIRVDLRRSLLMHRGLALGIISCGIGLAALYITLFWPHAPGAPSSGEPSVLVNAAALLLAALLLAIIASVAALRMDPRIYVGSDLKQLLGVRPMVELPDFSEVSNEIAGERLQHLAKAVAHACKEGSLKRCLFTGTGSGAGVTTIAVKVHERLESAGRAAMLVGATGAEPLFEAAGLPTMQEAADKSGKRDSLILTDAAPLTESADTEYLARFADCVMVVVESGVTTRAQLMATVSCLQRLNVGAVGFILNHLKLANADPEFRRWAEQERSVAEGDAQNRARQFTSAMQRALSDPPKREIVAQSAAKPESALKKRKRQAKPAVAKPTTALTIVKPAQPSSVWASSELPSWLNEALAALESVQPEEKTHIAGPRPEANGNANAVPAGGSEATGEEPQKITLEEHVSGNASKLNDTGDMLIAMGLKDPFERSDAAPQQGERVQPFFRPNAENKPSRLSGLRGLASAESLKELGKARHAEQRSSEPFRTVGGIAAEAETVRHSGEAASPAMDQPRRPTEGLSGLRGMFPSAALRDLGRPAGAVPEPGGHAGRTSASETMLQPPVEQPAKQAGAQQMISEPGHEPAAPVTGLSAVTAAKSEEVPPKPPATEGRDYRANYGDVQILPSKRGQYRRKK